MLLFVGISFVLKRADLLPVVDVHYQHLPVGGLAELGDQRMCDKGILPSKYK